MSNLLALRWLFGTSPPPSSVRTELLSNSSVFPSSSHFAPPPPPLTSTQSTMPLHTSTTTTSSSSSAPNSSAATGKIYSKPPTPKPNSTESLFPQEDLDALLEQFKSSSLPLSSRWAAASERKDCSVTPNAQSRDGGGGDNDLDQGGDGSGRSFVQKDAKPFTVLGLWRHAWFFAAKAKDLATDIAIHHILGPRRPTWGIEMTILASLARDLASNTHLADVSVLRAATAIGGYLAAPSDAFITPVTYKVRKRRLKGFLKVWDEKENGRRVLDGEWVIGKRLWGRLQREWRSASASAKGKEGFGEREKVKEGHRVKAKERVVLYIHGGAYYMASASSHRIVTIALSKSLDARVFSINYRLAPDTRFPGAVHDSVVAYLRLVEDLGIPAGNIILAGDSAGGGLCLALMMYLRDEGYEMPGGAILMCPWADLTMSCASWETNAGLDIVTFPTDPEDHMNPVACYLGPEGMKKYITHPYASPLFGDLRGLPPLLVQSGDCEVLRDEVTLLAHKAALAGVKVTHEVYEDAIHAFQLCPFLDQSRKAIRSCRYFVLHTLPEIQRAEAAAKSKVAGSSPSPSSAPSSSERLGEGVEASLEREIEGGGRILVVDGMGDVERSLGESPEGERGSSLDVVEKRKEKGERRVEKKGSEWDGDSGEDEYEDEDFPGTIRSSSRVTKKGDEVEEKGEEREKGREEVKDAVVEGEAVSDVSSLRESSIHTPTPDKGESSLWKSFTSRSFSSIQSIAPFSATIMPSSSTSTSTVAADPTSNARTPNRARSGSLTHGTTRRFTRLSSTPGICMQMPSATTLHDPFANTTTTSMSPATASGTTTSTTMTTPACSSSSSSGASNDMSPRARTTSHPDMVKLLKEFAMTGPANATSTFGYRYVDGNG